MKVFKIPEATIMRLSIYSRYLRQLIEEGVETVSSGEIAAGVGVSSAQVRKDLAYFGEFGTRGVGYKVEDLYGCLLKILGLDRRWNIIIIGAGKLGSAFALYQGFLDRGFTISAIMDVDEKIIGSELDGVKIEPLELLQQRVTEKNITVGVITVPAPAAQDVTDLLVASGVKAILNFSPRVLKVPNEVILRNVDLSVNLEVLSFYLALNNR
ncbi:MAG: redox-sensing transcriptional repressor Rex [Syntrophomonas sp.]|uniref:redox-sensing transcriptional repressor Rex n=1 Tax=Syntrophomonas sp. TaxID=2053627 RepID=UPI002607D356|nr:redox-sensing transcriptional repressor Rex [Syntrophomonas sp.]MDD2510169.1 redox-sensing transcriptional repressor Rex [Syntrophomonas sp.]MDD3879485.1 redox-sensing transcriptional repressor Rex [Syntrophomonas sp.]MDD4625776.1 redox-sensing transcriptional repressor Rex [Syntrophomonas sp.]